MSRTLKSVLHPSTCLQGVTIWINSPFCFTIQLYRIVWHYWSVSMEITELNRAKVRTTLLNKNYCACFLAIYRDMSDTHWKPVFRNWFQFLYCSLSILIWPSEMAIKLCLYQQFSNQVELAGVLMCYIHDLLVGSPSPTTNPNTKNSRWQIKWEECTEEDFTLHSVQLWMQIMPPLCLRFKDVAKLWRKWEDFTFSSVYFYQACLPSLFYLWH